MFVSEENPRPALLVSIPMLVRLLVDLLLLCSLTQSFVSALHLHGHYSTKEFFRLLTKFGVQKTDQHRLDDTFGYIYGNITLDCPSRNCSLSKSLLFLILDYDYFAPVYKKQRTQSCADMMQQIQTIAFHRQCNDQGTEDFWRQVPCEQGRLCTDEDQPKNVIPNQQFTFKIRDINQPRFVPFGEIEWMTPKHGEKHDTDPLKTKPASIDAFREITVKVIVWR